ncbi:hypothetical protein FHP25_19810 [Vineibacter terrae]|uniref:Transglutaminase domain-containing protein n=1 Tax=Vineibacter terrae TaxID=2586908 RepID=A0A5C8PIM0_9HYPH|nr:hypothetical protein [Vineibacter terrae]TXL73661.1 hypothetical protein FHP25_19810 [Vineibacter terrae]
MGTGLRGGRIGRVAAAAALGAMLACGASPASAQQSAFSWRPAGSDVQFSYAFKDAGGAARSLSFPLPSAAIDAAMALFRDYSMPNLYGHIQAALEREARRAGVTVQTIPRGGGVSFVVLADSTARREAFEARLDGIIEAARQEWLRKHARRAVGDAIHMDYPEAALRYVAALRPVAGALSAQTGGLDERARLARALSFVQAIPYDDLISPLTTGGIEFAPPPAMFKLNRGDCDSKTVALAAILRTLTPARRLLFVVLPQHVALAVDLPPQEGDVTIAHGGHPWVMLEPTGPAVVPPGQIAPSTAWYIERPGEITFFEMKE